MSKIRQIQNFIIYEKLTNISAQFSLLLKIGFGIFFLNFIGPVNII